MGGGDESRVRTGSLSVEILCQHENIPAAKKKLMIRIEAIAESNEDRRAPVTICAVIDKR